MNAGGGTYPFKQFVDQPFEESGWLLLHRRSAQAQIDAYLLAIMLPENWAKTLVLKAKRSGRLLQLESAFSGEALCELGYKAEERLGDFMQRVKTQVDKLKPEDAGCRLIVYQELEARADSELQKLNAKTDWNTKMNHFFKKGLKYICSACGGCAWGFLFMISS